MYTMMVYNGVADLSQSIRLHWKRIEKVLSADIRANSKNLDLINHFQVILEYLAILALKVFLGPPALLRRA